MSILLCVSLMMYWGEGPLPASIDLSIWTILDPYFASYACITVVAVALALRSRPAALPLALAVALWSLPALPVALALALRSLRAFPCSFLPAALAIRSLPAFLPVLPPDVFVPAEITAALETERPSACP
jgi:hypothetical protein